MLQLNLTTDTHNTVNGGDQAKLVNNAVYSVQNACSVLIGMLQSCQDSKLSESALKFSERVTQLAGSSLTKGKLTSARLDFGQSELTKGKNSKKIKVQPNRKCKSGNAMTWHAVFAKDQNCSKKSDFSKGGTKALAARVDKSVDFSPIHSIVYVHPPPTYLFRASASFTD